MPLGLAQDCLCWPEKGVMCYVEHQSFGVVYGSSIRGPVMFWRDDLPHDARHLAGEVLEELVERLFARAAIGVRTLTMRGSRLSRWEQELFEHCWLEDLDAVLEGARKPWLSNKQRASVPERPLPTACHRTAACRRPERPGGHSSGPGCRSSRSAFSIQCHRGSYGWLL